jgi:hypothetical protein
LCHADLAQTHAGEWTWCHACVEGYGVVHISGRFEAREKRRAPVLPMEAEATVPLCPHCRAPQPCFCGYAAAVEDAVSEVAS